MIVIFIFCNELYGIFNVNYLNMTNYFRELFRNKLINRPNCYLNSIDIARAMKVI